MREEERTKDQTSSHGVAYGYTLTNAVGGKAPYDSNKVLLGFIYPGVRVPGKPYVSVNPGKANQTTTFSGMQQAMPDIMMYMCIKQENPIRCEFSME